MSRKEIIQAIINEKPEAKLVANKYKVIIGMLKKVYPNSMKKILSEIKHETFLDIIFDAINGNRDWQTLTEGEDKENKNKLEKQWIKNNYKTKND